MGAHCKATPTARRAPPRLGVTLREEGADVAVFSRHADAIDVCLFDDDGVRETARWRLAGRDGDIRHGFIPGLAAGARYVLRADGPYEPSHGHWFDPAKALIDPYATRLDRPFQYAQELAAPRPAAIDTASRMPRCIVEPAFAPAARLGDPGRRPPRLIYEAPPRAFTMRNANVPEPQRGTLAGFAHAASLDHIARVGVSHVELMPVTACMDERHLPPLRLTNAWGYNPVAMMALDPRLAPGGLADLRALVAACHARGLAVLLDVVFNHTAESDALGPTLSLRGLDNAVYFRHAEGQPGVLVNDTGCGNTLACDRAPVVRLMMDTLRQFVEAAGVDGFRFDLAPILGRTAAGFSPEAPLLTAMRQDPLLRETLLIAEPWDIGPGGYQLGAFPAPFLEWNDRYRDDVRRFWAGDYGVVGAFATRLAGSRDVFGASHRQPSTSVDLIAAHDGFTLRDLVSYTRKRNAANGENNRDGHDDNHSWNCGVEGPADPATEAARDIDVRALLATLIFSRGSPMITAGDEFGRTQHGNNNAYCQDNDTTWLDWANADMAMADYLAGLVRLRASLAPWAHDRFLDGASPEGRDHPDVVWLRLDGAPKQPSDWVDADAVVMLKAAPREGAGREGTGQDERVLLVVNRACAPLPLTPPPARADHAWRLALDSAAAMVRAPGSALADFDAAVPARSVRLLVECTV